MDVYVLGPFSASEGGRAITPKAAKPRALLALFALSGAFQQGLRAGRESMRRQNYRTAMGHFDKCLALWRGEPLADVVAGPRPAMEISRLEGSRLSLTDWRIECGLMLGRHHDMLGELAGLTMQYPLHETLHGQYMLALRRAGRRSQALDVFQRLRLGLHAELGLEPSPVLQRLQRAVLSADPALEGERTTLETFRAAMAC